jgi:hypothetical protein
MNLGDTLEEDLIDYEDTRELCPIQSSKLMRNC